MDISEELSKFCYDSIYELANVYNSTLSAGLEYEEGFNRVTDMLSVPKKAKEDIFLEVLYCSKVAGIPYHKLSPVNQFIVTIPPYVLYCIKNKLPDDSRLKEEAAILEDNGSFYRYLQEQIGARIAQEIKGALWKPRLLGLGKLLDLVSGSRYRASRKKGQQADNIIKGLELILKGLFVTLADIYKGEFPTDTEETTLMRAGTVLNELVIEELRGEQIAFKEENIDFIKREKIRLPKMERIRKGILSFLTAKGAFYRYMNSPKAIIWINGVKELEPGITIPGSLDKIIDTISTYLHNSPNKDNK